jgi:pimeloyl-ACP methyl ester carboxylesterase
VTESKRPTSVARASFNVNEQLLLAHGRFQDRRQGISEEFLQPVIGSGHTIAVLGRPLGPARSVGWVVCHSFGLEQIYLHRSEITVARELARAGFPVLRYHGQGYGDSEADQESITLSSHLADAAAAVEVLRSQGVARVGVLGARFGGMVAALTADRLELPFLGLWDPAVAGATFIRDFLRAQVLSEMVETHGELAASNLGDLRSRLQQSGLIDVRGFPLTREAYEEISRADLLKDIKRFRGDAMILNLSRTGRMDRRSADLKSHLQRLGARCASDVFRHPLAGRFGQHGFVNEGGLDRKKDVVLDLARWLADRTRAWAVAADHTAERFVGAR